MIKSLSLRNFINPKKLINTFYFSVIVFIAIAQNAKGQSVAVTASGGINASYSTLKGAFDAINLGTHTGTITIGIGADITETATSVLNASGAGAASYTTITINPTGGAARTISGTINGASLIDLNGADNVTINGLNTGGNALTISNLSAVATTLTATIRFVNGATNNTITKCNILGSFSGAVGTNGGNIFFHTDGTTANGNDNNTISFCNLGPAGVNLPSKCIYGNGSTTTTAIGNSGIQILNNNIFDYFGVAVSSAGLYVNDGCNTWTITNNKFYQSAARAWTTGAQHSPIWIIGTSTTSGAQGFTITDNIIGFASSTQTGIYALSGAGANARFVGIFFNGSVSGTTTTISTNTISSISMTGVTGSGTSNSTPFTAINFQEGNAITNGNIIGSQTATGSLTFSTTTTSGTEVYGIHNFSSNAWTSNNNKIGGISVTNAGASGTFLVAGMKCNTGSTVTWTANSNFIGGSIANSIQLNATGTSSQVIGLFSPIAPAIITGDTIRNLSTNIGTGTTTTASLIGINLTSNTPNSTLSQNTIFNLSNTNSTAASVVTGIQFAGAASNLAERNKIYGLTVSSNSSSAEINGIRVAGGTTLYRNNMIALGAGVANAVQINGIIEPVSTGTDQFFHNSIFIDGNPSAGTGNSFAFNSSATTTRSFRDNIFVNARSNSVSASGKNYIIKVGGTTTSPSGLTLNNNIYQATGSGAVFGSYNGSDVTSFANWKTTPLAAGMGPGLDANSFNSDPKYKDPTNAIPDLHIHPSNATVAEANGTDVGVADDFDGSLRSGLTPTDIGADAGNFTGIDLLAPAISYTALTNTTSISNRTLTGFATITDASGVNVSTNLPRIYYKRTSDVNNTFNSNTSGTTGWKFAIASNSISPFNFTIDYSLLNGAAVSAGDVIQYFIVAQDLATTPNVGINSGSFTVSPTSVALTSTAFPINGTINSYLISPSIGGTITVPSATYPSLTLAGGAFAKINAATVTSNITIEIAGNLTGENGTVALNAFASPYTVTIQPAAFTGSITGSSTSAIITLNGADRVTINGSSYGETNSICSPAFSRDLIITNTNTGTSSAVVWLQSNGSDGATNNTITNCIINGSGNTQTLIGIGSGSNAIGINSTGATNNNNSYINNIITKTQYGIYSGGASAAVKNTGTIINQNLMNDANVSNNPKIGGILLRFDDGAQVIGNRIENISMHDGTTGLTHTAFGIALGIVPDNTFTTFTGNDVINAKVSKNIVGNILQLNSTGYSAFGIVLNTVTSGISEISNNMIYDIRSASTPSDFSSAILAGGGTGSSTKVYYNTVSMTGTRGAATSPSYCLLIAGADPVIDVRNNILLNKQTSSGTAKMYAIGTLSSTFVNLTSNNNDLFVTGTNGFIGQTGGISAGVDRHPILGAGSWNATTTKDAVSQNLEPVFQSSTNLHINAANAINNPLKNAASISITDDIDCENRVSCFDIGADEFDLAASALYYTDTDHDGFGNINSTGVIQCNNPGVGFSNNNIDCNDGDIFINPVVTEICGNNIDENCNGQTDENHNVLTFDGLNDNVNLGNTLGNFGTSDFTVEFWMKTTASANQSIISKRSGCNFTNFWDFRQLNNKLYMEWNDYSFLEITSITSINDGAWHHIAGSCKGSTAQLYIDGVLEGSATEEEEFSENNISNANNLLLGEGGCDANFTGSIYDVRLWNIARTQLQIQSSMNADLLTQSGLIASYNFNQGIANGTNTGETSLIDASGNNNTGTLTNFALSGTSSNWTSRASDLIWHKDADNDLYSDGTILTQCTQPTDYFLAAHFTALSGDCDDNNSAINSATAWYKDADNDLYSDGTILTQCTQPSDYFPVAHFSALSGDCDDNNPAINPATIWYKDADGDLYSDGSTLTQCTQPSDYFPDTHFTDLSGDCDDNNPAINPATIWYKDADNDLYSDGTITTQCTQPSDYFPDTHFTSLNGDCDDNNAAINPATIWYKDADNDLYSDGTITTQCTQPSDYFPDTHFISLSGDCYDDDATINPAASEVCGNGFDDDCDGQTDNNGVDIIWYSDFDGDFYGNGISITQCSQPAHYFPASHFNALNGDCNDAYASINPAASEVCGNGFDDDCDGQTDINGADVTFYSDFDGDLFSNGLTITQCLLPAHYFPASHFSALIGDCNDADNTLNPSATEICGNNIDENCNGQIDESQNVLTFDVVNDNVNLGNTLGNFNDSDFTIEFWLKTTATGNQSVISKRTDCTYSVFWNFRVINDKIYMEWIGNFYRVEITSATSVNNGMWHHIAGTRNGSSVSLYIDGILEGTATDNDFIGVIYLNNDADLLLGAGTCEPNFSGSMHDVRIWNIARTQLQIQSALNSDLLPQSGLIANYKFNQGIANGNNPAVDSLTDASGNNNTGSLTNFALTGTISNWTARSADLLWYKDADADLYSDGTTLTQCSQPADYFTASHFTALSGDCNDNDATVNPGISEICGNGIDDDCNEGIDENGTLSFSITTITICNNYVPYLWNGINYSLSGIYHDTLYHANASGCDSIATLELTIIPVATSTTSISICRNQTPYQWNGIDFSSSGIYRDTLENAAANGCDSIATLELIINPDAVSTTSIAICSNQFPYHWNEVDYFTYGTYTDTLENAAANGCDSIETLELIINPDAVSTTSIAICSNQFPYHWNEVDYFTYGTYTDTLENAAANGCDSIAMLELTISPFATSTTSVTICSNQIPYHWNGVDYSVNGTYNDTLENSSVSGCDSIATLNLTIKNPPNAPVISPGGPIEFCQEDSVSLNFTADPNTNYQWRKDGGYILGALSTSYMAKESGNYDVIASPANSAIEFSDSVPITAGFRQCFIERSINVSGLPESYPSSEISVRVNVTSPSNSATIYLRSPGGQVLFLAGPYLTYGNFINTIFNDHGASIYSGSSPYTGTFSPNSAESDFGWCLYPDVYSFSEFGEGTINPNGQWHLGLVVSSTIDPSVLNNWSIIFNSTCTAVSNSVAVNVKPFATSTTVVNTCIRPYVWNGNYYNTNGTYTDTLQNGAISGCDSIATLILNSNPASSRTNLTVCSNTLPFHWNNQVLTQSGEYSVTLTAAAINGCDSIAILNLLITPPVPVPVITMIAPASNCGGESILAFPDTSVNNSLYFNGSSIVTVNHNPLLNFTNAITIEAWIKPSNFGGADSRTILMKGNYGWGLALEDGYPPSESGKLGFWDQGNWAAAPKSTGKVIEGVWNHIAAVVVDAGTHLNIDYYINGVNAGSVTSLQAQINNNSSVLEIGRQAFAYNLFAGDMDELRIWNVARTQTQIQNGMNVHLSATPGLIAYYRMNEGSGTITADEVNQLNGTLSSGITWLVPSTNPSFFYQHYLWSNGETTSSIHTSVNGNYTLTVTYGNGCINNSATVNVNIVPCSGTIFNLSVFIQGFYSGAGTMNTVLLNSGAGTDPDICDSITVELHDALSPSIIVESINVALHTDGTASAEFSSAVAGNSYYIVIRHRNSIETWSKDPVTFGAVNNFDFTH